MAALSACDTQPVKPGDEQQAAAESLPATKTQITLTEEAEKYLLLAEESDNLTEQYEYRRQAAHLFIEAGELRAAKNQLAILEQHQQENLAAGAAENKTETASIMILSADIAIAEKNKPLATEIIAEISPVTRSQQIDYYALKADLDYLSGDYMYAVDRRVQLDNYITDKKHKDRNYKKIWVAISNLTATQLDNQQTSNLTIKGWLDLARVMRSSQQNISQLENNLLDWGTRYPDHPANDTFLVSLINDYQVDVTSMKHIAVFLPMQGDLSKVTSNIKNGFLSAYYSDQNIAVKPVIQFYDSSNKDLTFFQLYQQAIDDGATNIIGPLNKVVVNQLTQQKELDIPVLTLNYAESTFNTTENLFQFGLSPEDEARQVAELAIRQNKMRAAVFYPDSEWGKRLSKAFSEHYILLGGSVMTSADYATDTNDYRRPIKAMFNLDKSTVRLRRVENTIGKKLQYEPYRRQDIDMIFLAATHRSARSIMPAFKFHHASGLPVYSTSHVYTGKVDRDLDRDLNGLIFCDLPWILQNNSSLEKTFNKNWPQQESFTRLFALGIDAYHLIYNLDYLKNKEYAVYAGQTGNIQLDENNRFKRTLLWAKFKNGTPVYFEPEKTNEALTAKH